MEPPRPIGAPDCRCGAQAPLLKSRTEKNPNRWFFKCDTCGYFKWADELAGYPNIASGPGGVQLQHTPQRQGMQNSQQQQQPFQSPGIPHYHEAGTTPQGAAAFSSPARQTPAFGVSGGHPGYASNSNPAQHHAWQHQSPMQQPQWSQAQQQQAQQQHTNWVQQQPPQIWQQQFSFQQQQPTWQQQSPVQQQHPGWQQQQQQQTPTRPLPAAAAEYPDITRQPISTFGNLQQPGLHMQSPTGAAQFNQSQVPCCSQGSQGADSEGRGAQQPAYGSPYQGPGSQQQGYWSQQQQHSSQPGQQQGHWAQHAGGAGGSTWQQQQYTSPNGRCTQHSEQPQLHQQQLNSPARPGVSMPSPAQGFVTPGGSQQQSQHISPQRQQQQASPVSPGSGIVVTVVPPPAKLPNYVGLKTQGYKGPFVACMNKMDRSDTDRHWEPNDKMWVVLQKSWPTVEQKLKVAGFVVKEGDALQGNSFKLLDMAAVEASDARLIELLSADDAEEIVAMANFGDLWDQLMPHQQEGVLAGVRRGGRVLLADEMGLGKTAQAIVLSCCYPADWPLLVVVPASLRGVWVAELQAWIPPALLPQRAHIYSVKSGQDLSRILDAGLPNTKQQIMLITYDLAKQIPANIAARFGVVICDESHHLKNRDALRTQSVGGLVRGAKRGILLTGTPLLSRPIEAWSQVDMLRPGLLGSYDEYGKKYCTPEGEGLGSAGRGGLPLQPYQGCNRARADELHRLLLANVMVRRTKAQVGLTLPAKTRMKVTVPLDPALQPQLVSIRSAMERLSAAGQQDTPAGKRLLNEYYMASGAAKVSGVVDFILSLPGVQGAQGAATAGGRGQQKEDDDVVIVDEQPAPGSSAAAAAAAAPAGSSAGKLLVFAYHHEVLNALQDKLCEAHNIGFIRIDGSTTPQQRHLLVDRFQTDASVQIGLLSMKAAGAGLTLTAASRIVFAELHWNPTDLAQCEDRIHRVGQQIHCSVYYCLAAHSSDSLMWSMVVKKLKVVGATVDGMAGASSAQGMAGMQNWQQHLSQQQQQKQDKAAAHGTPPAAAAATAAACAPAAAGGIGDWSSSQQQQSHEGKLHTSAAGLGAVDSTVLPDAAARASSRRRSLLDAFMEAGDVHSSGATVRSPATATPGHFFQMSKPPAAGTSATTATTSAGIGGGNSGTGAGSGGSAGVDSAPAGPEDTTTAAAAVVTAALEVAAGSIPSNTGTSVARVPMVAAVTLVAQGDEQCSGLGDAATPEVAAAAAAREGGGSHAGSQAGQRAATQGSQSTMAVGEQQLQPAHMGLVEEGITPAGEQPAHMGLVEEGITPAGEQPAHMGLVEEGITPAGEQPAHMGLVEEGITPAGEQPAHMGLVEEGITPAGEQPAKKQRHTYQTD